MMEDGFWWKMTYNGRLLMMEDDLWWKMTYDGRRFMMEDDLCGIFFISTEQEIPMEVKYFGSILLSGNYKD